MAVLIAGGGIGGLTTAIALGREGIETSVLERTTFAEESGAGIQLGPNATRILRALGVLDALAPHTFRPEAVWLFDGISGRKLGTMPLSDTAEERYGAPYLTVHRADLHASLKAAAVAQSGVSLRPGFAIAGFDPGETVSVANLEGTAAQGSALIGADGLWSTVRKQVAPDAELSFTGATAFRSLLLRGNLPAPFDEPIVGLWLGPNSHLVHYPVRSGKALNVVAVTETGQRADGWNRSADGAALSASFTHWGTEAKALLAEAEAWRAWSLFALPRILKWSHGAVTLLGDAAHPVLPYLAQGAGLAIEDAATLAQMLGAARDRPTLAFRAYEAIRRVRAERVQRTAQRLGRAYHMGRPLRLVRNTILGLRSPEASLRSFDWLYGTGT